MTTKKNTLRKINQGDIYWLQLDENNQYGAEHPHPYVVIQDDAINHSRVETVVLCALTTNMKKINMPGNVLLSEREANLPRQSIVVVSQVVSVRKETLGEYVGSLSTKRIAQVFAGLKLLENMSERRE